MSEEILKIFFKWITFFNFPDGTLQLFHIVQKQISKTYVFYSLYFGSLPVTQLKRENNNIFNC